jgi:hypothetical protein
VRDDSTPVAAAVAAPAAGDGAAPIGGGATGGSAPTHGGSATGGSAPSGGGVGVDHSAAVLPAAAIARTADFYDKLAH